MKIRLEDYEGDIIEDDGLDGDHVPVNKKAAKKEYQHLKSEAAEKISRLQARDKTYKRIDGGIKAHK